ncbi:mechanosensitive ion channel [Oceanispirochaeta crateris]|uniref:Mechanosensitive ion channel n=1 Tax=Oceanispirochaeta crateris TaxID=2518645 RepID=A0A5C1QHS9_9SPIO|nr:mechanosensitive ion channel domain-containing protein [Oceanispirochaeta crateris]QEN07131.1 mechanosensitive ion channel [Oceanispirochaeta crateris]
MNLFKAFAEIMTRHISIGSFSLPFSAVGLITRVLLPFFAMLLLYGLINWIVKRILTLTRFKENTVQQTKKYTRLVLKILVIAGLAASIGNLLETEVYSWYRQFLGFLNSPFFVSGNTRISVVTLLMLVPVFYLASWSGKYAKRILDSSLFEQLGMDEAKRFSIGSMARYIVMTMAFLFGLSVVGIDLSALSVILGVLGLGLGFGLQSIVANFFAGLIIISTRPIKEGDRILVNGLDGIVQHIRFISTDIKTFENQNIIIPNSHFVDNAVHNYSYSDRQIVIENEVAVSYNSDLERVRILLEEINERNPYKLGGSENIVRIRSFGDNGINVCLRSLIRDVNFKFDAHSWTNMEIWKSFKLEGIEIPFPQRDVHIKSMPDPDAPIQMDEDGTVTVSEDPED